MLSINRSVPIPVPVCEFCAFAQGGIIGTETAPVAVVLLRTNLGENFVAGEDDVRTEALCGSCFHAAYPEAWKLCDTFDLGPVDGSWFGLADDPDTSWQLLPIGPAVCSFGALGCHGDECEEHRYSPI